MFCKVISHQQTICWVFSAKFAKYELLLNFELKSNSVNCHLTDSCFVTEDITEELLIKYSCQYVWITHRECIVYVSTPVVLSVEPDIPGAPLPEFTVIGVENDAKFFLLAFIVILCPCGFADKVVGS